jgi:hypothetical protein
VLASELFEQNSILLLEVVDHGLRVAVDPTGHLEKEELGLCVHGQQKIVNVLRSQNITDSSAQSLGIKHDSDSPQPRQLPIQVEREQ